MMSRYTVMAFVCMTTITFEMAFIGSTINIMLINIHGMDPQFSTLVSLLGRGGFLLAAPVPTLVLRYKLLTRLQLMYVAHLILGVTFLLRPGNMLHHDDPLLYVTLISSVFSGFAIAQIFILLLPEIMDSFE